MSRPRVLHVITSTGVGGAERALERLVLGLRDRYEFAVLSLKAVGEIGTRLREGGIEVEAVGAGVSKLRLAARLWRQVQHRQPDVVHAWLFQANFLARFAAGCRGIPNISSIRTLEKEKTWQPRLDALTSGWVDQYLAVSQAAAEFTAERGIAVSRIRVIPNGLTEREFEEPSGWASFRGDRGIPGEAFLVLCAGRFRWEKAQGLLIQALGKLRPEGRPVWVVLAGSGPDEPELRRLASEAAATDRVLFPGTLRDLRPAMRAADLLVLPSRWEGMPNVVLEAAAQGTPALATRVGGVLEVIREGVTGVLVPPERPEAIAEALEELRADPERCARLGEQARNHVRDEFPIRRTLDETAQVYEAVLARAR